MTVLSLSGIHDPSQASSLWQKVLEPVARIAINCNYAPAIGAEANGVDPIGPSQSCGAVESGASQSLSITTSNDKAEQHVQRLLARLRVAHQCGLWKKADYLTKQYLQSADARNMAAIRAYRKLSPHRRPCMDKLPLIANRLNPWEGTDEPVILSFVEKPNKPNYYRAVQNFGIENRTLQYLVLDALRAQADLHPSQYALRGLHAAIKRVAELMASGYIFAVEIDIKDCFTSFDGDKVVDLLPLPKKVTKSVLLNGSFNLVYHSNWTGTFGQAKPDANQTWCAEEHAGAQRGFPQGSAASPLAVEMLLAPLFDQLPATGAAVGYADNFLALGKTEQEAVAMSLAFGCALKAHPAGHLAPNPPNKFGPGQPIEFLGHRLQMRKGTIAIDPTPENVQKFWNQLSWHLSRIKNSPSKKGAERAAAKACRYLHSWTSSFALCGDISSYKAKALNRIELMLS